jgi:pimeloyl-ACP methyl ester carboxylesterase
MIRNILEAEAAGVDIVAHSREFISSFISLSFNKWCYRMLLKLVIVFSARSTYIRGYFNQMSAVKGHETKSRLHLIHAPTLVMTGTGDKLVEPRFSEMLANGISHARLVKVNGGSHAFFIEMSGRFNREVLDFLTDS